jgi:hypothetical protein
MRGASLCQEKVNARQRHQEGSTSSREDAPWVQVELVAMPAAPEETDNLKSLPWFGLDVTTNPAYQHRRLALDGLPTTPEVGFTNAALAASSIFWNTG